MLSDKILELIECKSSENDNHVAEDPIFLVCGYSACRKCWNTFSTCIKCKKDHKTETLEKNWLVVDLIKSNIKELKKSIDIKI